MYNSIVVEMNSRDRCFNIEYFFISGWPLKLMELFTDRLVLSRKIWWINSDNETLLISYDQLGVTKLRFDTMSNTQSLQLHITVNSAKISHRQVQYRTISPSQVPKVIVTKKCQFGFFRLELLRQCHKHIST